MAGNKSLNAAMKAKNDEFYTQLSDIEDELKHYTEHFKGKTVLCNCDDPRVSNFFHYFAYNFEHLGLRKLITTCYKNRDVSLFSKHCSEKAVYLEYTGDKNGNGIPDAEEIGVKELKGNGDFRSPECVELLKQADIVVTNPPFSLFREYVAQLMRYGKKFVIIGNQNNVTYKEVFTLIKNNKLWLGYKYGGMSFRIPKGNEAGKKNIVYDNAGNVYAKMGNICWFTNLEIRKRHETMILYKKYNSEEYPKYDNYDAIFVKRVSDIPVDWDKAMGVPITFLDKFNPEQFEILGITDRNDNSGLRTKVYKKTDAKNYSDLNRRGTIKTTNGYISKFPQILIRKKK